MRPKSVGANNFTLVSLSAFVTYYHRCGKSRDTAEGGLLTNKGAAWDVIERTRRRLVPLVHKEIRKAVKPQQSIDDFAMAVLAVKEIDWHDELTWLRLIQRVDRKKHGLTFGNRAAMRAGDLISKRSETAAHGEVDAHELIEIIRRCRSLAKELGEASYVTWLKLLESRVQLGTDQNEAFVVFLRTDSGPAGPICGDDVADSIIVEPNAASSHSAHLALSLAEHAVASDFDTEAVRVYRLATELRVQPSEIIRRVRAISGQVPNEVQLIDGRTASKIRQRIEYERAAGHGDAEEVLKQVIAQTTPVKRRRRRRPHGSS